MCFKNFLTYACVVYNMGIPQECNIHRGQKRKSDPLELQLHAFVRYQMWNHLERMLRTLKAWAISLVLNTDLSMEEIFNDGHQKSKAPSRNMHSVFLSNLFSVAADPLLQFQT